MSTPHDLVIAWLDANELEWTSSREDTIECSLPGITKLATPVRVVISPRTFVVEAFVCRAPDENHQAVYRWLLERNLRLLGATFAVDRYGDIFLHARLPVAALTPEALDQLMGALLSAADDSFNTLLELGFATSIRKEWQWRIARGESTANLEAFRGWLEADQP